MDEAMYFLRYAYPCMRTLEMLGKVTPGDVKHIDDIIHSIGRVEKEYLEKIFTAAISRLKHLAKDLQKDYWDMEVIREYFLTRHNTIIDSKQGSYALLPETMCAACKVYTGKVKKLYTVNNQNIVTLTDIKPYYSRTEFINFYNLPLQQGDIVSTHFGFVIEVLKRQPLG